MKIDGLEQKVVIIGKLQYNGSNTDKLYDYAGVDYPVGFLNPKEIWMFDAYKIKEVIHKGYVDETETALNQKIAQFWKQHPEKR